MRMAADLYARWWTAGGYAWRLRLVDFGRFHDGEVVFSSERRSSLPPVRILAKYVPDDANRARLAMGVASRGDFFCGALTGDGAFSQHQYPIVN